MQRLFNSHASSSNGGGASGLARTALDKAAIPLAGITVGVAGGIVLGRSSLQRNRKTLGLPVPTPGRRVDLRGLGQQIGEAGRQFAKLAQEVHAVREKAEQIGRAIS
ncbi:MAG: hypothetical protein ACRDNK_05765 [Solirubrobacteraceae bacterium]